MPGQDNEIIWVVVVGSSVVLLMVIFIVSFVFFYARRHNLFLAKAQEQEMRFRQELMQSKIETQEETFSTLSKELHDNIGQLLNSAKLFIGIARRKQQTPVDILQMAGDTLSKAIYEIRSLSKALDKEWLERFNFVENLIAETERLNTAGELQVLFSRQGDFFLPSEQQIILFRIVQEALQNAIKHSQAKQIRISVNVIHDQLEVSVSDDGIGLNRQESESGSGFDNMRNRAHLLRGNIYWETAERNGTVVTVSIPVQKNPS